MNEKFRTFVKNQLSFRLRGYEQIAWLLFLGIFIRVVMSFFTSHPDDEEVWYITGINMLSGQGSPYGTWYFSYPPAWAYIFMPFLSSISLFSNPYFFYLRMVDGAVVPAMAPLFNFAVKIPIIAGDVLVGLIIYHMVRGVRNDEIAKKAFIVWFLNPLVIYTGAFLAQFDVLPALFSLLAFAFFLHRKYLLTGASLSIATMTKVYPVFLIPLYLVWIFKQSPRLKVEWRTGLWNSLLFVAGGLSLAGLLLVPVLSSGTYRSFIEGIFRRGDYITSIGGPAPSGLLLLFGDPIKWSNEGGRPQQIYTLLATLQIIGVFLVLIFLAFRAKQNQFMNSLVRGNVCILVIVLLTNLTVNPQYLLWIMPFLVLDYGLNGNYGIRLLLLSASGLFLAFYWGYPFHSITAFVNRDVGLTLSNTLMLSLNPQVYFPLVILIGLLGAFLIILLPFQKPRIQTLRILLRRRRKEIDWATSPE